MNYTIFLLPTLIMMVFTLEGQVDSVAYAPGSKIEDGIYLSYEDLRHGRAIRKEQIISDLDKTQQGFMGWISDRKTISYLRNDSTIDVRARRIFGYFQNGTFYINIMSKNVLNDNPKIDVKTNRFTGKGKFYRVLFFGGITYFMGTGLQHQSYVVGGGTIPLAGGGTIPLAGGGTIPLAGGGMTSTSHSMDRYITKPVGFLMDFYTGRIVKFTMYKAKKLLSRDSKLYEDFEKLPRYKRKQQVYSYIRRYNEKHPVYFLKS